MKHATHAIHLYMREQAMQKLIADFSVRDHADKENKLALALESAIHAAKVDKNQGVLVTRHAYDQFTVALSSNVPYGHTHELDLCSRAGT